MKSATRGSALQLSALFLVACNLRIAMACIGPVLETLRHDLQMTRAQAGLLSTLPVLCMSLFAPLARRLSARHGNERTILFAIVLIAVATSARVVADTWLLLSTALAAGIGIAIAGTLLNTFVKQHFAGHTARVSGVYSAGICVGAALAAALTAPLTLWLGDSWRDALGAWCLPAFLAAALWWAMMRRLPPMQSSPSASSNLRLPWRSGKAWIVTLFFGLQSIVFYVVMAWLAPMYIDRGWTASAAGALLGNWMLVQVVAIVVISNLAHRSHDRRPWLIACSLAAAISLSGFAFLPLLTPWLWMLLLGFAAGGTFALTMTLPLDYSHTPHEAGSWTAMMLFGGYLISAGSPWATGFLRDVTSSYATVFASVAGIGVAMTLLAFFLKPIPELHK